MFLLNCLKRKCIPDSKNKAVFMDSSGSFWLLFATNITELYLRDRSQVVLSKVFRLLTSKNFRAVKCSYSVRTVDREGYFSHFAKIFAKAKS